MEKILQEENIIVLISIIITMIVISVIKFVKIDKTKLRALFFIYINFMICFCAIYYLKIFIFTQHTYMIIGCFFSIVNIIILKKLKLLDTKIGAFFILFMVLIIELGYISYTPFYERQHDSRSFSNYEYGGHFGYMGYIFYNNHLPKESPKDFWCFYNPPLFYIISVFFIKIQSLFNLKIENCLENLQILSVIYTMIFNIYVYKILKEIGIKKSILYILSFIGLAPAMIIMSGSLNNDILSIMLSTMSIYYTIKWYNSNSILDLIKIALTISFAMMTKISSALIAIPISFVFLDKIIKNKKDIKKYIINFAIFSIIALPIGLWFPIKNLILYNIPPTYVQSVDKDSESNISRYSKFDRLFNFFQKDCLKEKNVIMSGENSDNNIFITTIKSFLVDERINYDENLILKIVINLEFYCACIVSVLFIINIFIVVRNYKKINNRWILFFLILFLIEIFSYIKFCFDFPFVFTMNFRYIIPTLISYGVITGLACENNKKLYILNNICLSLFSVLSIFIFTNLR